MPAGFHHDAVASSATAVKAPPIPLARTPTTSAGWPLAREPEDPKETKDTEAKARRHTEGREALNMPLTLVLYSVSFETLCVLAVRAPRGEWCLSRRVPRRLRPWSTDLS